MTACMVAAALLFGGMGWMGQKSTAFAAESTPTMRFVSNARPIWRYPEKLFAGK